MSEAIDAIVEDTGDDIMADVVAAMADPVVDDKPAESEASPESEAAPETEAPAPETDAEPEQLSPPDRFSEADKTLFSTQPREVQEFMLARHKEMEGDYTRKTMEQADFKKTWDPVQNLFSPHEAEMQAAGTNPGELINQWIGTYRGLQSDPVSTLVGLAQQYGVDLSSLPAAGEEGYTDPALSGLQNEINQLRSSIAQREQSDTAVKTATVESQIQTFREEKTDAGEPAHPYFEEVMDDMVSLASAEVAQGKQPDLVSLYERAVWMNPSTRTQLQEAQRVDAAAKEEAEARQKAEKARLAGFNVSGSPDGEAPMGDRSIEDIIRSQL